MEVLALLAGAAALDVVHADGDRVVAGVDHGAVARVSEAAVSLPASAVAPLELAAYLRAGEWTNKQRHRHTDTHTDVDRRTDVRMQKEKTKKHTETYKL